MRQSSHSPPRRAWRIFSDVRNLIGGDCGFAQSGMLWLATEDQRIALEENVAMLRRIGADIHTLSVDELPKVEPRRHNISDIAGATWEPHSGYADPVATTQSYAEAARKLGVHVYQFTSVTSKVAGGRITAVITDKGEIRTEKAVDAAGIWGGKIAKNSGLRSYKTLVKADFSISVKGAGRR